MNRIASFLRASPEACGSAAVTAITGLGNDDGRRFARTISSARTAAAGLLDPGEIRPSRASSPRPSPRTATDRSASILLPTAVEIASIAVRPELRRAGYAARLLSSISRSHGIPLVAETDDHAVGFYRRVGFDVTEVGEKGGRRRYRCVLPAPR